MIKFFRMKKKEIALKLALYSTIENFMNEKEDVVKLITNLYLSLKDTPVDDLRDELMGKLAEVIHEEVHKTEDGEPIDK